ncbi:MAG TPA: chemotaxis protein CheD [Candidatus Nitrosotenuis sp.]|nr:chemotaxis protein CheD [Candidatus Nitrosotenuis sp.]
MSFTRQEQESVIIEIPMGGLGITTPEKKTLQTFVGSCVAVCVYDATAKIAGMAHVMLPKNNTSNPEPKPEGKFADVALKMLVERLVANGADASRLRAKMAGGANVFRNEGKQNTFNIGGRNIDAVRSTLKEKKIPLVSEDVGSNNGRWVTFDASSGQMTIRERTKGVTVI